MPLSVNPKELDKSKKKSQILLNNYYDDIRNLRSEIDLNHTFLRILDESFDDLLISAGFLKCEGS